LPPLYFTFSRGTWMALAAGLAAAAALAAAVVLSSRRLQLISALLVRVVPAAVALGLAYRAKPLRLLDAPASQTVHTRALAGLAARLRVRLGDRDRSRLRPRCRPPAIPGGGASRLRRSTAAVLAGFGAVLVHFGGPAAAISHLRKSISSSPPAEDSDLSTRLFSLSSNGQLLQWHVALD
jgi:hypothetical protein